MAQASQLLQTLKRLLRARGITYAHIAARLDMSESSVKRLFARQEFSLQRLESVCGLLDMELSELAVLAGQDQQRLQMLSEQQEAELVADIGLLLVAISVLNQWPPRRIVETYRLSESELTLHLLRLDKLGLIELRAGNRVRLKLARDFSWRPQGPIQRFFADHVRDDFFATRFQEPGEQLLFVHGMLSPAANARLQARLRRVVQEFNELHGDSLEAGDEREGCSLLLALRPWEPEVFARLRRGWAEEDG